jgi:hypothetical protein
LPHGTIRGQVIHVLPAALPSFPTWPGYAQRQEASLRLGASFALYLSQSLKKKKKNACA